MAHITGQSRYQTTLFPESLDELIPTDHPGRVIDAFVDSLELARLGFTKVVAQDTGRPPYAPGDLLKLYIYGYLNRVRSSRLTEREARRNIEVLWLMNRVTPTYKTIADFRKDHAQAIVAVCRTFIQFCRGQQLFGAELLAMDGTKIQAVASRKQVVTPKRLAKQIAALDGKITEYLGAMDEADREEPAAEPVGADVAAALQALQEKRESLKREAASMAALGLKQRVATEPEAALMRTAHQGYQVAYNAQTVVDAKHKLIAAFDLVNDGNDHQQLHPMAVQGKEALAADAVTVVADAGYSNGEQGKDCEADGVTAVVPRADVTNPSGEAYFRRDRFDYDAESDTWRCPAGETLTRTKTSLTEQKTHSSTNACGGCRLKAQCTKAAHRVVVRGFYEDAMQAMHQRAVSDPKWMRQRREIVEHPFGTIKWMMGYPRFLVRGLKKAKAELALNVLGYNLKRVINLLGVEALLKALRPAFC